MVLQLSTSLSESQTRFFVWLEESAPYLQALLDVHNAAYCPYPFASRIRALPAQDYALDRGRASVWGTA